MKKPLTKVDKHNYKLLKWENKNINLYNKLHILIQYH